MRQRIVERHERDHHAKGQSQIVHRGHRPEVLITREGKKDGAMGYLGVG